MKHLTPLLVLCLLAAGCRSAELERLEADIAAQEAKITQAETGHRQDIQRFRELQDSLQIRIQTNLDLGMSREEAAAAEQALLNSQRTVLDAATENLNHQREYLNQLKNRHRIRTGKPE